MGLFSTVDVFSDICIDGNTYMFSTYTQKYMGFMAKTLLIIITYIVGILVYPALSFLSTVSS